MSDSRETEPDRGPVQADWIGRLQGASALGALVFAGLLIGSGIGLAMTYVPSRAEAFDSLLYLRRQAGLGSVLRSMHYHLSSGAVVATFLMVLFGVLGDSHRERKGEFRLGVLALLLMIGFCFTGYVLPMDQAAYWGTTVRLGIVETVPVVGGWQADLLRGGPAFSAATLPRFYALHITALPLVLVVLVLGGFKGRIERAAQVNGARLIAACILIACASWLVALALPAPLEPRAAPADTEYVPRPEWYFLWLFQFGKYVHSFPWVQSTLLPVFGIGTLLLLPDLRLSRPARRGGVVAALAALVGLSALALYEDRNLPPKPEYEAGLAMAAARNYAVECAGCHGESGRGDGPDAYTLDTLPSDLTRPAFWDGDTLADIVQVATIGIAPDMPAFGDRLSSEEILALARHIETNFRPTDVTSR